MSIALHALGRGSQNVIFTLPMQSWRPPNISQHYRERLLPCHWLQSLATQHSSSVLPRFLK